MSDSPGFIHLRVHSVYSLKEGALHVKALPGLCEKLGFPALAVTDTNALFGALEFSECCARAGVQPIMGLQLAVAYAEPAPGERPPEPAPLALYAQDETGWRNLMALSSAAFLDTGASQLPHVTLDALAARAEGLICLTGGANGPLGKLLQANRRPAAEALARRLSEMFPGRLYVELQRHGSGGPLRTAPEEASEPGLVEIAYTLELPLVATNEVYFETPEMFQAHDAFICIGESRYVNESDRRQLTPEHYLKSGPEMAERFADLPEALANTLTVARRCAYVPEAVAPMLPAFPTEAGRSEAEELRTQSEAGLEGRLEEQVYTEGMDQAAREAAARSYRERLKYELEVIEQMGYPGYFLIVADFIQWAKRQGIPVGPGRGSGAGSVVSWALTITGLDPLRWGLLFERFLNPERVSMPDFDIDFCQERRDEVIRYVQEKYGRDHVAQIITFGKLQARAALRDVGRVLQMPYPQVDRICKLVPNNPANPVGLQEAIEGEPRLQEMRAEDPTVARLLDIALKVEGLYRHASTHAAGVVIGDRRLDELIPLYRDPRSDMAITQFSMKYVELAGLVKFDFLGLKTLSVLARACELIAERGTALELSRIPLDDAGTYDMLARGDTVGVFQLESSGMRDVIKRLKADRFEDIIAVVALFRPGPMDNIPSFIARKHGEEAIDYLYPTLEGILKETFGIMIYQEQVMQIAQELAGYSLGGADLLRRAMGKKIRSEMEAQRKTFIEGAVARAVPAAKAEQIFEQVNKFAGYGFVKSHAAAYALVAYQTAYLKVHYPVEFLAASMTFELGNTEKLSVFRQELKRLGIALLPPDINRSTAEFGVETVEANGMEGGRQAIRYALAAVKNVGEAAMRALVAERDQNGPFASLGDFAGRVDMRAVNKRQIENLARAGAFDGLNPNRRQVFEAAETVVRHASAAAGERDSAQENLFGGGDAAPAPAPDLVLPQAADWPDTDRLRHEFEAIGFYLSAHPLDAYGAAPERWPEEDRAAAALLADSDVESAAGSTGSPNSTGSTIASSGSVADSFRPDILLAERLSTGGFAAGGGLTGAGGSTGAGMAPSSTANAPQSLVTRFRDSVPPGLRRGVAAGEASPLPGGPQFSAILVTSDLA
ncbi:MAG: DNA polymerase III subunit alpha, partial [Proteobacteria bacterium]|nr:DNA polymerase III subunit alpha [Pseudomonadota bacterium]